VTLVDPSRAKPAPDFTLLAEPPRFGDRALAKLTLQARYLSDFAQPLAKAQMHLRDVHQFLLRTDALSDGAVQINYRKDSP
jgi:hypothetical protein